MRFLKQPVQEETEIETLVQMYYPKLYAYLYRRTREDALAKDLTQETFYRFFAHQDHYQEQGKCLHYLYRIAAHLLMDHHKASSSKTIACLEEQWVDPKADQKAQVQARAERKILRKWVYDLPDSLQEVIILRCDEELKFHEIAAILDCPISTVKSRWKLAVTKLQERARKEGWK